MQSRETALAMAARDFVAKVDRGEARSVRSYSLFKAALALESFQTRVLNWLMSCFSMAICRDVTERNHRFLEEALELVQSTGCKRSEAHMLVEYVFNRPPGIPFQEVGGVAITFSALCSCIDVNQAEAGEAELNRISDPATMEKIRIKQAAKPQHSPLPI